MPQMFPLMWFILFSSSSLALLLAMSTLYFNSSVNIPPSMDCTPSKSHSWKW